MGIADVIHQEARLRQVGRLLREGIHHVVPLIAEELPVVGSEVLLQGNLPCVHQPIDNFPSLVYQA